MVLQEWHTDEKNDKEYDGKKTIIISIELERASEIGFCLIEELHRLEYDSLFSHDEIARNSSDIASDPIEEWNENYEDKYYQYHKYNIPRTSSSDQSHGNEYERNEESDNHPSNNVDPQEDKERCEVLLPFCIKNCQECILQAVENIASIKTRHSEKLILDMEL